MMSESPCAPGSANPVTEKPWSLKPSATSSSKLCHFILRTADIASLSRELNFNLRDRSSRHHLRAPGSGKATISLPPPPKKNFLAAGHKSFLSLCEPESRQC